MEQHTHDIDDIKGAGRLFTAFIREEVSDAVSKEIQLPTPEVVALLQGHVEKLSHRHADFKQRADALCGREDISEATVSAARERLNELLEANLTEFAFERERILERALKGLRREKLWRGSTFASPNAIDESIPFHAAPAEQV